MSLFHFIVFFFFNSLAEKHVKDPERPQKFGESWTKSIRQISYDSPKPIDTFGIDKNDDKTKDKPSKKSVPARNSWSALVDSESGSESIVPDSEEESVVDEQSENEYIDDEAVEVENYNSGDSMDESERREAEGTFV